MMFKKGILLIAFILTLMFYMITTTVKAYKKEEGGKDEMHKFMQNSYLIHSKEFS